MQSPSKRSSAATGGDAGYIHGFGYHLAKKLLGSSSVEEIVRQSYELQLQEPRGEPFHCFRANWRSGVRHPWQLPKLCNGDAGKGEEILPETLFVDVTFDFVLFPFETVTEGRTKSCHVLKMEDIYEGDANLKGEANSIALAVAVRIGALMALPASLDNANAMESKEGYEYFYLRGDNALAVSDVDEHCQGIDIVLEEMSSAAVAGLVGDAFLEGGATPWQVMGKVESSAPAAATDLTTVDSGLTGHAKPEATWKLKLHHKALEADGLLPLSSNSGFASAESVGEGMLDTVLLQSNADGKGGGSTCIAVPTAEARKLWQTIDPALMKAVEQPVAPSPQKMSPSRSVPVPEEEKKDTERSSKPKAAVRRPPRPQENVLYARGKTTTLGGARRKKMKFTLGGN
ncbi:hypothetical protein ACHAXT_005473 [Thalassiosira profunda]